MLDNEEDWIEKYRAALVQQPPSRRVRIAAAFSSLATALGFGIGRISRKHGASVGSSGSSLSHQPEVQEHPHAESHSPEPGASKKSAPLEHRQDKRAS